MKVAAIAALAVLSLGDFEAQAIRLHDDDLDALMAKYDKNDQSTEKKAVKKVEKKEAPKPSGPSSSDVQDMELKILSGNNLADSSARAADDDMYNESLEKFSTASKKEPDTKILTKDNALEAWSEIYQKKYNQDPYEHQEEIKKQFNKVWDQHDNLNKGYVDYTEGYSLVQDLVSGGSTDEE